VKGTGSKEKTSHKNPHLRCAKWERGEPRAEFYVILPTLGPKYKGKGGPSSRVEARGGKLLLLEGGVNSGRKNFIGDGGEKKLKGKGSQKADGRQDQGKEQLGQELKRLTYLAPFFSGKTGKQKRGKYTTGAEAGRVKESLTARGEGTAALERGKRGRLGHVVMMKKIIRSQYTMTGTWEPDTKIGATSVKRGVTKSAPEPKRGFSTKREKGFTKTASKR